MTFGYISQKASSVTAPRRARVAVEATRVARRSDGGARRALGVTLVTIGQRIAGELPASRTNSDCA
jgi:hypothetical protein